MAILNFTPLTCSVTLSKLHHLSEPHEVIVRMHWLMDINIPVSTRLLMGPQSVERWLGIQMESGRWSQVVHSWAVWPWANVFTPPTIHFLLTVNNCPVLSRNVKF